MVQTPAITPVEPGDLPTILELGAGVIRAKTVAELEQCLLKNPYFPPDSTRVLRSRLDRRVLAAATLVTDPSYADPKVIDAMAPCFRLGAFGTEGMTHKRVKGLFSLIAKPDRSLSGFGLELMGEAAGASTPMSRRLRHPGSATCRTWPCSINAAAARKFRSTSGFTLEIF